MNPAVTDVNSYNYELPEDKIAKYPLRIRGASKLMIVSKNSGFETEARYRDLAAFLNPGDLVILNNTKVFKARLEAKKTTGGVVELILLEKHYAHGDLGSTHRALYRGKLREGETLILKNHKLRVHRILEGGVAEVSSNINLEQLANRHGQTPIPPYLKRKAEKLDERRYQSQFAQNSGSVAAPTASLNFTQKLHAELIQKNIGVDYLTLHVGLGTFLPIRTDDLKDHQMHQEFFHIPRTLITKIRKTKEQGGRVIAVGTTVTRALEYAASGILNGPIHDLEGDADIFIYPGYQFQVVDGLLTNFHAPKSTVLMMASAFAGWENLRGAYQYALDHEYRFLSYGDSMLII